MKHFWQDVFDWTMKEFIHALIFAFVAVCLSTAFTVTFIKYIDQWLKFVWI